MASIIITVPSEILYIGLEFPLTEMKTGAEEPDSEEKHKEANSEGTWTVKTKY